MADDLSLLFKIRGDAAGATKAAADTRAAVASLRANLGNEFNALQSASKNALQGIGDNLNLFVGQRIPLVGGAFLRVTENIKGLGTETKKGEKELAALSQTINGLAQTTGKSSTQITAFLQNFVQLETQAKRDISAIETFGAATAQSLIPELEKAGEQLVSTAAAAETAGASFAALAGPVGIAVVAVLALAAAGALVAKELFDLAEKAADFRGKLFDLSQQTGVSVETLSALEILAKTTGSSIEQITASLGIFQKNLETAQDPTSKQAALLRELGVSADNTEQALRDTLSALGKMPEGFKQTATALELFGRGGKSILAILKETNGDLDGAITRLRELGLVVSTEDAKAADEFNDQLALVQFQLRGLLGKEVIPAALEGLKSFSELLKENKQGIDTVAKALGSLATVIGGSLIVQLAEVAGLINAANAPYVLLAETLERIVHAMERLGVLAASQPSFLGLNAGVGATGFNFRPDLAGGGEVASGAHAALTEREIELEKERLRALKEAQAAEKQRIEFVLKLVESQKVVRDQLKEINTETHLYAVNQSIANGILKQASDAEQEEARRQAKKLDNLEKQLKLQNELRDFLVKQNEQVRLATEGEKSAITIGEELIVHLQKEGAVLQEATKEHIRNNAAMLRSIEIRQQLIEAIDQHVSAMDMEVSKFNEADASAAAGAVANAALGPPPAIRETVDVITELSGKLSGVFGLGKEGADVFGNLLSGAFSSLAQAVGDAVQAFILFGNSGTSIRKFTATLISEIAKMAAVQAVWELAQGLAMLALNFFIPDPRYAQSAAAHFQAAAVYGGIALIAAGAGRAVAGGAFAEQGSSGSGGGGTSGGSNSSSGATPATQQVDRRNYEPMEIRFVFAPGLHEVVEAHVVKNWNSNGRIRTVIQSDGQG